jgi:thioredoxin-related protein
MLIFGWLMVLFFVGTAAADTLKWYSFEEGMALGPSQGKKVYIHFRADWCQYCHTMEQQTFRNPTVVKFLNQNFISVKVDTDREKKVSETFRVKGLPDNWFVSESGDIIGHRPGYIPPDSFLHLLKIINTAD